MPYVAQDRRATLDNIVEHMSDHLLVNGDLNYVLYAFCKRHVTPSYNNYKNYCGELEECVAEIRRRITAKYEDEKVFENGDVD